MKKLLKKTLILAMLVMLVISLASCEQVKSILGKNEPADDNQNIVNDTWNMSTVYAQSQSLGYEGTLDEFIALVSGKDGVNGKDGVGIKGSFIDKNGHLILILTNGETIDAGLIKASSNTSGRFAVTFDYGDGTTETVYSENYRVEAPIAPAREDYDFGGWYFEESSLEGNFFLWLFDAYSVTKDMTLYANWIPNGDPGESGWWDKITYDSQSIIFQMTNSSNKQELPSGCERFLAGESYYDNEPVDTLVKERNSNAYKYTKVNVSYKYYPDNDSNYYFSEARNQIINTIDTSSDDKTPDIFCNWMTDMLLVSLKGKFANIMTTNVAMYPKNHFNINMTHDEHDNPCGYMGDLMRSLTLNPGQVYVIASDYFIDTIRSFYVVPVNVTLFNNLVKENPALLGDLNYDGKIDVSDFYVQVENGDWTYDTLIDYSEAIYYDDWYYGSEDCNDVLGFALGKNGLPAAGMIYSSSASIIKREFNSVYGGYTHTYPDTNEQLASVISKISDMMKIDGIMCMDKNDAATLGLAGVEQTALLGIRHKFTNNTLLFGGITLLGSLEFNEYQNMKTCGGFGVVPVPVAFEGDDYLTQMHITARVGAVTARKTEKFEACSAFLQYQSTHSAEVLEHYYKYNFTYGTASGVTDNMAMLTFIRNRVRTSFDKLFEDAIGFFYDNGINEEDRYHTKLADSYYEFDDFSTVYNYTLPIKKANLKSLVDEYAKLPK